MFSHSLFISLILSRDPYLQYYEEDVEVLNSFELSFFYYLKEMYPT